MKILITIILITLASMSSYAYSPHWTDDVDERFKSMEAEHNETLTALRLITVRASRQCKKQLNDKEVNQINMLYQTELYKLTSLFQNLKENKKKIADVLNSIQCLYNL